MPVIKAIRMPLYFILSGLFFKDYGGFYNFIIKKTNKILIPFCAFVGLGLLIALRTTTTPIIDEIIKPFSQPDISNLPVWFLICLFWVNILYFGIQKFTKNLLGQMLVVVAFGLIGYILGRNHVYLPLFFSSALSALPFFYIGIILRKTPLLYKGSKDSLYLIVFSLLTAFAVVYCCMITTPFIDFRSNTYNGHILLIWTLSPVMVIGLLLLCKLVTWIPIVSYLGRYSIIVLGLHSPLKNYAHLPIQAVTNYSFSQLEILVFSLLLCWIAIPLCRKYLPKLTAQSDLIKSKV